MQSTNNNVEKREAFARKVAHMRLKIMPIYPLPGGPPHHDFPLTMLQFYLLGESQLDAMATYYSQSVVNEWTTKYPGFMAWDAEFFADPALSETERVKIKLRKFGHFIGLRGCETPIEETVMQLRLAEERIGREIEQAKDAERAQDKIWKRWHGV
ncbi:pre-mrna splicing [Diplodia corticola]|uniref:Pre-mrna splicing n=1 Tax=Diplodia corticola TaxID=236234 RepID=A0A1J9QZR8_9PEZI|nr:pre-mrna splicing [Diplodia corticola]OJD33880.1 pre-mrna splicing [Diplodia corticola]